MAATFRSIQEAGKDEKQDGRTTLGGSAKVGDDKIRRAGFEDPLDRLICTPRRAHARSPNILDRIHRGICAPEASSAKWCVDSSRHVISTRPQLFSPASCCCCCWLWSLSACVLFALPCPLSSVARPLCHVTSIYQSLYQQALLQYLLDASPVPIVRFSCLGALSTMPASPPAAAWPRDRIAASPPTAPRP